MATLTSQVISHLAILIDIAHPSFTDFNVAVHYSESRLHKSVAGSMAYMAPEVLGRKGYTWCIDWWSLGVTTYELLLHKRPFEGRNADKMRQSILQDPIRFPDDVSKCSLNARDALKSVCRFARSNNLLSFHHSSFWTAIRPHG
jgi:serine/threonine kinase 32